MVAIALPFPFLFPFTFPGGTRTVDITTFVTCIVDVPALSKSADDASARAGDVALFEGVRMSPVGPPNTMRGVGMTALGLFDTVPAIDLEDPAANSI